MFTSRDEQMDEELLALNRFRMAAGELAGAAVRDADPPDFAIHGGDRRVTVELTRYHQDAGGPLGSARALQESAERRLMSLAKESFVAANPALAVAVSPFFREGVLTKANVPRYAHALAALVARVAPPDATDADRLNVRRCTWDELHAAGLDYPIVELSVMRHAYLRDGGDWRPPVHGHVATDTAHLLSRIREKERDLPGYRRAGDESWLIVYAPPLQASGFFDLDVLSPGMFESTFDTVVFLDVVQARYVKVAERAASYEPRVI